MPDMPNRDRQRGFAILKLAIIAGIIAAAASNAAWWLATRRCSEECSALARQVAEMRQHEADERAKTLALMTKVATLAEVAKMQQPPAVYLSIMDAMALYVQQGHAPEEVAAKFMFMLSTPPPRKD